MAAKCEKCGSTIEGGDFCPVCGASTRNQPAAAIEPAAAGAKPAWARDIPIVNNRYIWIHWGWACLLFVGIFTVVFAASSAVFAAGAGYTVDTLVGIDILASIAIGGFVIGTGLFGALSTLNKVAANFT